MRWWKVTLATLKKIIIKKAAAHFIARAAKGLARVIITYKDACACSDICYFTPQAVNQTFRHT